MIIWVTSRIMGVKFLLSRNFEGDVRFSGSTVITCFNGRLITPVILCNLLTHPLSCSSQTSLVLSYKFYLVGKTASYLVPAPLYTTLTKLKWWFCDLNNNILMSNQGRFWSWISCNSIYLQLTFSYKNKTNKKLEI